MKSRHALSICRSCTAIELCSSPNQVEEREKKLANGKSYVKRSEIDKYETERYYERCTKRKKMSSDDGKKEDLEEDVADQKVISLEFRNLARVYLSSFSIHSRESD